LLIQTFEHGYKVISHVLTNDVGKIYICKDVSEDQEYTILRLSDKAIVPELMIYLTTRIQKHIFADYIEHFVFEDDFCIVLKYYRGISFFEKLKNERCSLKERLELGSKIFEKIVLLDMPLYFQKNCLMGELIVVRPSLDIDFNYLPSDIRDFAAADDEAVLKSVIVIFNKLFADELSKQSAPPINQFYTDLQNEKHFDNIELYKRYIQMCRKVESIPKEEVQKPKSKLFLLWERLKKQLKVLKKILIAILLVLAVVYLIWTIREAINPTVKEGKHFEYIGSEKILENQDSGGQ
jgi:hypothetical protein